MITNKHLLGVLILLALGCTLASLWQVFGEQANASRLGDLSSELAQEREKIQKLQSDLVQVRQSLEETRKDLDALAAWKGRTEVDAHARKKDFDALQKSLAGLEAKVKKIEEMLKLAPPGPDRENE